VDEETAAAAAVAAAAAAVKADEDAAAAAAPAAGDVPATRLFLTDNSPRDDDDEGSDIQILDCTRPSARLALLRCAAVLLTAVQQGVSQSELDAALEAEMRRQASSDGQAEGWLKMLWRRICDQRDAVYDCKLIGANTSDEWELGPFADDLREQSRRVFECMPLLAQQLQLLLNQRGEYWQGRRDARKLNHALLLERCNEATAAAGVPRFQLVDV
jgi:hypothetical protein